MATKFTLVWWDQAREEIKKGICPVHGTKLDPVGTVDGRVAGLHPGCGYWWTDGPDKDFAESGWHTNHKPINHDGPVKPDWAALWTS